MPTPIFVNKSSRDKRHVDWENEESKGKREVGEAIPKSIYFEDEYVATRNK